MSDSSALVAAEDAADAVPVRFVDADRLEDGLAGLPQAARRFAEAQGFKATAGSVVMLPGTSGDIAGALFGIGRENDPERSPMLAGQLATKLPEGLYRFEGAVADARLAALAFLLGGYRFDRYKQGGSARPRLVAEGFDADAALRVAEAVAFARDLVNLPANALGPAELTAAAAGMADRFGAETRMISGEALERDFPMIHAVGAASDRPPCLIDLTWGEAGRPKVTLVGKGVVFDTGGLDIKPAAGMALMKKDMGGGANVLGLAQMIMAAGLPVRLRVLVPAVENAISGRAFRPGDVLESRKGLTVEIGNTDAEGRLVLADALALADEEAPDLIVSMATLTGAARVALGPDLPAYFTHDDGLAADLDRAAAAEWDPVWRLPLWRPYHSWLSSKVADLNHIASKPFAGAIVAALFLDRFVEKAGRFVHFDLFAWNSSAKPAGPEGGEAQAIRALFRLISERYGG
ncbi:MAG TPA: leucyl aminopeptidase family protein [Afifellaceae bacterium]|nr:leucyl aminopeptidase family protein [Afifellaceae bacterium]